MNIMNYFFIFISVASCIFLSIYIKDDEKTKKLKVEEIKFRYFSMGMYVMFMIVLNIIAI